MNSKLKFNSIAELIDYIEKESKFIAEERVKEILKNKNKSNLKKACSKGQQFI